MLKPSPSSTGISQTITQQTCEWLVASFSPWGTEPRMASSSLPWGSLYLWNVFFWLLCASDGPTQPLALFSFLSALLFISSLVSPSSHAKYKQEENNKLLPLAQTAAFPTHSLGRKVSFKGRIASAHSPLLGMSKTHFPHQEFSCGRIWCQLWR